MAKSNCCYLPMQSEGRDNNLGAYGFFFFLMKSDETQEYSRYKFLTSLIPMPMNNLNFFLIEGSENGFQELSAIIESTLYLFLRIIHGFLQLSGSALIASCASAALPFSSLWIFFSWGTFCIRSSVCHYSVISFWAAPPYASIFQLHFLLQFLCLFLLAILQVGCLTLA